MFKQLDDEQRQKFKDEAERRNAHFSALTHEVFENNPKGREWLELVTEDLLVNESTADPAQNEKFAYFREGMNSFVRNIRRTIKLNKMVAKEEVKNG